VTEREPGPTDDSPPTEQEVEALIDELKELQQTVDSPEERRVVRRTIRTLDRLAGGRMFGLDDIAQQTVGGFVLSAPFVVTGEVWDLAAEMNWIQWGITVLMVVSIGYGALYRVAQQHDADSEESIAGLPLRFVSLVLVSYLSVTILTFVFAAPTTFGATPGTTLKAVSISAIFAVVGAATADSLFG
jgi:uncharacterized membrane protein